MVEPKVDPAVQAHLEWLGFVRPNGLVVSAPALVRAGAILDRRDLEGQQLLRDCAVESMAPGGRQLPYLPDFAAFARSVLGWSFSPRGYGGMEAGPIPPELEVALPEYGEVLYPDLAVRELDPPPGGPEWQLLARVLSPGVEFDQPVRSVGGLEASAHSRMERLLRATGVGAGLLFNGHCLRLVSAPSGESSGWIDFQVADMVQPAGRPISSALRLLLSERRLLALPRSQRLAALLEDSRRFQNEVSERLAEQVLHALYELLRGLQAAHLASGGELLRQPLAERPDDVYHSLLSVILRLVFLLYAEECDLLPEEETFLRFYSLGGLYERLRADAALNPDTMDQRFGAWAQLLVLFRMVHDGARAGEFHLPDRHGGLFDPDRYPFLEGRPSTGSRQLHGGIVAPLVPDGTIFRALEKLLILDGERISYRALDVEQIGSVYETMMGFRLNTAAGASVAIKPKKRHGAPAVVDLDAVLAEAPGARIKWLEKAADRSLPDSVKKAVLPARTVADLHSALFPVIDVAATPDLAPAGAMVLQPSEARRRSGSHYTPRALTAPIVRTALEPVLFRLRGEDGALPRPEKILELKVCDPAMGSGAFLVEACRQLGDALVDAWHAHGETPLLAPDVTEFIAARRLVAQRCLYGVDRNPVAVDLAKVSLWLVTLASEHPLTFLDHALRHGDSLVGLSRRQIEAFHWDIDATAREGFEALRIAEHLGRVAELRAKIRQAGPDVLDVVLQDLWDTAEVELGDVRLVGDLAVAAFFAGTDTKARTARRLEFSAAIAAGSVADYEVQLTEAREADPPLVPFHWEVEFPEVFERPNPGFDVVVGNPPFAGKNATGNANPNGYLDWLKHLHEQSHGNADLVAHFFRRAFTRLRAGGVFGLLATNTIAQGDTRSTGLRWICTHGGEIFEATKRYKWPGTAAAVVVSIVHVMKGPFPGPRLLDGRKVDQITAFLVDQGGSVDPARLRANDSKSFVGSYVLGMGFTFDDGDTKGIASSLGEMRRLIEKNPANAEVIFPYIGGEEVNTSPTQAHRRYVIDFYDRSEHECRRWWPDLIAIVEEKVKPERDVQNRTALRERWWQYAEKRPGLHMAIAGLDRVLAVNCGATPHLSLAFLPRPMVYAHTLTVFAQDSFAAFSALQARPHEVWARFFGSSMKDDLRYTPSDCFETFPFPEDWEHDPALEVVGSGYYAYRAELMVRNNEGLTKTYNRFHDPYELDGDIMHLRDLHTAMDRAVLGAYGWTDLPTSCEFLLDYGDEHESDSRHKKPWRYRWPDDVRDEVLARLLALNAERAQEEARWGETRGPSRRGLRKAAPNIEELF